MIPALIYFTVAMSATLGSTEFIRTLAFRLGAVDLPGGRRVHLRPTARLGGLAIFAGFGVALILATCYGFASPEGPHGASMGLFGVLAGGGVMLVTGLIDDVRGLPPLAKLAAQVLAALLVYVTGWHVETIGLPHLGMVPVGAFALPLTVGWIVFATNAFNLIDGLDGLACGLALIAAIGLCAVLPPEAIVSRTVAVVLAGALLGFLWFNIYPALIFMGDAGSLFVGFVLATVSMRASIKLGHSTFPLIPMMLMAVPIFDACSAVTRRLRVAATSSRSPLAFVSRARACVFAPDRGHVHHRLLDAGFSKRWAMLLLWTSGGSFAFAAWLVTRRALDGLVLSASLTMLWWRALLYLAPPTPNSFRVSQRRVGTQAVPPASEVPPPDIEDTAA